MGYKGKKKQIGSSRQPNSAKSKPDKTISAKRGSTFDPAIESGANNPLTNQTGAQDNASDLTQNPNTSMGSDPSFEDDDGHMSFESEEHMEEVMLDKLDFFYNNAVSRLVSLGFNEEVALDAILRNGHCFGELDTFSNIVNNSLSYLDSRASGGSKGDENSKGDKAQFTNLQQRKEYSLNGMVSYLLQLKPHLTRGDAMWSLLMCDLHITRACMMDLDVDDPVALGENECSDSAINSLEDNDSTSLVSNRDDSSSDDEESAMLNKFMKMNLDEKMKFVSENQMDEMMLRSLICQISDLEKEVEDRKKWAYQKVLQAATRVVNDVTELKTLRIEREQRLKQSDPTPEDLNKKKRLSEMESGLRNVYAQMNEASATIRHIETENAEMRAEIEATKLSSSESMTLCKEATKREKKLHTKQVAWEKQKSKIQEEICAEKQKISEAQQLMVEIEASKKDIEAKLRDVEKERLLAASRVEEEMKLKEAVEAEVRRRDEALHMKIEIDSKCKKDDLERLQEEHSRLKALAEAQISFSKGESSSRVLEEWEDPSLDKIGSDRECIFCKKDEVSVVFLPCAHMVLCVNCHEGYEKGGGKICPCCRRLIEERKLIFV